MARQILSHSSLLSSGLSEYDSKNAFKGTYREVRVSPEKGLLELDGLSQDRALA